MTKRWKECGRKQRYASEEEARRMMGHARKHRYEASRDLRAYSCRHCGGFHLTSASLTGQYARQPAPETVAQRIERSIFEARQALQRDRAKGWPTLVHETRIAQLRVELAALAEPEEDRRAS